MPNPPHTLVTGMLEQWGPGHMSKMSLNEAQSYCRSLTLKHGENFSVLTRLVPKRMQNGMCAVYAFCRWADDLADEIADPDESMILLSWWRDQLNACFAGECSHPVFVALAPVIERHGLTAAPFEALLAAFVKDQTVRRYARWDELIEYCRGSADPVGRLVLALADEPCSESQLHASDAICTALQLTNHWQDVRRDLLERDRIYLPAELHTIDSFETRLRSTATAGHAPDPEFLAEYRTLLRTCIDRTWSLFESGDVLLDSVDAELRPVLWLFPAGGTTMLRRIEQWNFETCLGRPRMGMLNKIRLMFAARRAIRKREGAST